MLDIVLIAIQLVTFGLLIKLWHDMAKYEQNMQKLSNLVRDILKEQDKRIAEIEVLTQNTNGHIYRVTNKQEDTVRQMEKLVKRHETALNYAIRQGHISTEVIEHEQTNGR